MANAMQALQRDRQMKEKMALSKKDTLQMNNGFEGLRGGIMPPGSPAALRPEFKKDSISNKIKARPLKERNIESVTSYNLKIKLEKEMGIERIGLP